MGYEFGEEGPSIADLPVMLSVALGAITEGSAEGESVEIGAASAPRARARRVTKRIDMVMVW
jgi:hypothetical protein